MGFRYLKYFDWMSFFLVLIISVVGLMFVFSATYKPECPCSIFFKKQVFGVISGLVIYLACCIVDYRKAIFWGYVGYLIVIGLLVFTLAKGHVGMGGQRWIDLGFTRVQPSELVKIFFPAFATYYFYARCDRPRQSWHDLLVPILIPLALSTVLVFKQPDLGTAVVLAGAALTTLWLAGADKRIFVYGALVGIIAMPIFWHVLKPYQRTRVTAFLGQGTPIKERYQIEQAKVAIGSGGIVGKGFLCGTQNKLQFVPEGRTDFIFSVLCEEMGFMGAFTVLILYAALFLRLFWVVQTIKPREPKIFALGLIIPVVFSAFINIGMVLGLLPSVGVPLPLMTCGISQTWTTCAGLGAFAGIAMRRCYING